VVPGAGDEVDRAAHGAVDVAAGGQDPVAQADGHPAGPDPCEQIEVGLILADTTDPAGARRCVRGCGRRWCRGRGHLWRSAGDGTSGPAHATAGRRCRLISGRRAAHRTLAVTQDFGVCNRVWMRCPSRGFPVWGTRCGAVGQAADAVAGVADDPAADRDGVVVQEFGDLGCAHPGGGEQDDDDAGGDPPGSVQGGDQFVVLVRGQVGVDMRGAQTCGGLVGPVLRGNSNQPDGALHVRGKVNSRELQTQLLATRSACPAGRSHDKAAPDPSPPGTRTARRSHLPSTSNGVSHHDVGSRVRFSRTTAPVGDDGLATRRSWTSRSRTPPRGSAAKAGPSRVAACRAGARRRRPWCSRA
jgi:hypothetical protein